MNQCFTYSAFGLCIRSEIDLPQFLPSAGTPDVEILLGKVSLESANRGNHLLFNDEVGGMLIEDGRKITVQPAPGVDLNIIRVILSGRGMAFLLRQRGWLPLHASGVIVNGGAVLFLGESGAGKSSTAMAMRARGHSVITDDIGAVKLVNGICQVCCAAPVLRLGEDSIARFSDLAGSGFSQWDKETIPLEQSRLPPVVAVRRIYILEFGPEAGMMAIPPLHAAALLSLHSFIKRAVRDRELIAEHVRQCAEIAACAQVSRAFRVRNLSLIDDFAEHIEADLRS